MTKTAKRRGGTLEGIRSFYTKSEAVAYIDGPYYEVDAEGRLLYPQPHRWCC